MIFHSGKFEKKLDKMRALDSKMIQKLAQNALEYLWNGSPTIWNVDEAKETIEYLAFIYLECAKADVNFEIFENFLKAGELNAEQIAVIVHEYRKGKTKIQELCTKSNSMLNYHDMNWRFEAKVGSRALLNQTVPLISMDLKLGDSPSAAETTKLSHIVLQTDPSTLIRMADSLEKALIATRSRNIRKLEKQMKKLTTN